MEIQNIRSLVEKVGLSAGHKEELFDAVMSFYLTELHLLILNSWHEFAAERKELEEQKDASNRVLQRHIAEDKARILEGERRSGLTKK